MTDDGKLHTYRYKFRTGTKKFVTIEVIAASDAHANFLCRKEMAQRFKGKTFKRVEVPKKYGLKDHL